MFITCISIYVGADFLFGYLKGKVYAVRIYNRALSDEEVKQNYTVDKVRFGL